MKKENIKYNTAGENIAAGQTNSIFVHNALMNSYGHRKNILGNYKYIGVGVVFGGKYKTYYADFHKSKDKIEKSIQRKLDKNEKMVILRLAINEN